MTGIPIEQVSKVDAPLVNLPPSGRPVAPVPPGMAREITDLLDGEASLQWPVTISPSGVEELSDWLLGVVHKLRKRAGLPSE